LIFYRFYNREKIENGNETSKTLASCWGNVLRTD
jgi:hypothetical protein